MADELSQDDIDALLSGGMDDNLSGDDIDALLGNAQALDMPDFSDTGAHAAVAEGGSEIDLEMLYDVDLNVRIELGRTQMEVDEILHLRSGSVVPLDKDAGAPVDIMVNDRLVATGEVLVLNDFFCVRVTEILSDYDRALLMKN